MAWALSTAVHDRVAVAEVVGLDHDGVSVVAELGEVRQVAGGREWDVVDVGEAVRRIGIRRRWPAGPCYCPHRRSP